MKKSRSPWRKSMPKILDFDPAVKRDIGKQWRQFRKRQDKSIVSFFQDRSIADYAAVVKMKKIKL